MWLNFFNIKRWVLVNYTSICEDVHLFVHSKRISSEPLDQIQLNLLSGLLTQVGAKGGVNIYQHGYMQRHIINCVILNIFFFSAHADRSKALSAWVKFQNVQNPEL